MYILNFQEYIYGVVVHHEPKLTCYASSPGDTMARDKTEIEYNKTFNSRGPDDNLLERYKYFDLLEYHEVEKIFSKSLKFSFITIIIIIIIIIINRYIVLR